MEEIPLAICSYSLIERGMAFNPKDHYYHRAKKEGFLARSAFKLEEIHHKFKILKMNQKVLDLGYFPGSWSQFASSIIGKEGILIGLDIQGPSKISLPNASFFQMDINDLNWEELLISKFDLILSDMAPKTTGIKVVDQAQSMQLCEMALWVCEERLKKNGSFVVKVFEGPDFQNYQKKSRGIFESVKLFKPKATRSASKEIYLIGLNKL